MNEIWKDIDGYEGLYQVSNLGRVKSLYDGRHKIFREKILKPGKSRGYFYVTLQKTSQRKNLWVHRLVGKAFIEGWFEGAVINHLDHNRENNIWNNLEWTTQKENSSPEKSFSADINAKLKSKKVYQFTLDGIFVREWPSTQEVERQLGFDQGNICLCCNGKLKSAYGYRWRYS